jgi:hypothetical protein
MKIASSVVMVGALLWSCNPFAPDQKVVLGVSKLEAPATISAGSPLNIVVTVTTGGCTSFDRLEVQRDASSATLTAWGIDAAKGEKGVSCPTNIVDTPHNYQFDPPFSNPFTIQVQRGRLGPLTATVQVQ